jgi:hypothetical protein
MEREMEIIGGGKMHVYPPADETPHQPGAQENWQESVVLTFWDLKNSVGGYFRIGHEHNFNGGQISLWSNVMTPEGVFHRADDVPLRAEDKSKNGFSADNGALRFEYDGQITWTVKEKDLTATLKVEDFHPAIDGYQRGGKSQLGDYAPQHVEVACRVTGTITSKGKTYQVDGLGMRDHGWGVRTWDALLSHRWTVGTFDKDNSFCTVCFHAANDSMAKFGWVVRGDKIIYADKVDVVSYIECDGTSNRGGVTRMTLSTGEMFEAHFEPVTTSLMSWIHGTACMDTLCKVRWGDRIGAGQFESTANMQHGTRHPTVFDGGVGPSGWYPAKT